MASLTPHTVLLEGGSHMGLGMLNVYTMVCKIASEKTQCKIKSGELSHHIIWVKAVCFPELKFDSHISGALCYPSGGSKGGGV